jgi:uncharacterized membrane protein (DUF106 family)
VSQKVATTIWSLLWVEKCNKAMAMIKKIGVKFTLTIMSSKHNNNKMDCNELIQNEEKPLMWTIYVTMNLPKL